MGLDGRRMVRLPDGTFVPAVGQGTWLMGEDAARRPGELASLRAGLDAGLTLIDTAEMYGEGAAESLVGEVLRAEAADGGAWDGEPVAGGSGVLRAAGVPGDEASDRGAASAAGGAAGYGMMPVGRVSAVGSAARARPFLVSKVYPHNAGRDRIFDACAASRARLGVDCLDLYLLHWRGEVPLAETVSCMGELVARGWIRRWGVSNFDVEDMEELLAIPGGESCATNQVLYHLGSRGIEVALLPWMRAHGIPAMAYCPLAQGGRLTRGLLADPAVRAVAERHGATPAQVLLAFVVRAGDVIAIPKAGSAAHARENAGALSLCLDERDVAELDAAFPAPEFRVALDTQ